MLFDQWRESSLKIPYFSYKDQVAIMYTPSPRNYLLSRLFSKQTKHLRVKRPLCRRTKTMEMFPWEKKWAIYPTWAVHDEYYAAKTTEGKASTCFTSDEAVALPYDWHLPAVTLPRRQKSSKIRKTLLTHHESTSLARVSRVLVESWFKLEEKALKHDKIRI